MVTGASGFIGKPIVNKLLMMGCEVLAIGREIPAQKKINSLHWLKANFSSPETYQAEINALKSKENFKFTKLHEKRLIVLEKIYKLLNKASKELSVYVSPIKFTPKDTIFEEYENNLQINYVNAHNEFVSFFNDNKIYLNEIVIGLIENYLSEVSEIYNDYSANHMLKNMGDNSDAEIRKKAFTAYKKMPEKVNPIKKEIEDKFREILEK